MDSLALTLHPSTLGSLWGLRRNIPPLLHLTSYTEGWRGDVLNNIPFFFFVLISFFVLLLLFLTHEEQYIFMDY